MFVLPPSFEELRNRLIGRGTESEEDIAIRLKNAREEVKQVDLYQYILVNGGSMEDSYRKLKAIVDAEKQRRTRCILTFDD